jgi:hypothetical protein
LDLSVASELTESEKFFRRKLFNVKQDAKGKKAETQVAANKLIEFVNNFGCESDRSWK